MIIFFLYLLCMHKQNIFRQEILSCLDVSLDDIIRTPKNENFCHHNNCLFLYQ